MWQQRMEMPEQREMSLDAIRENGLEADVIFACGPKPMLRAIEEHMPHEKEIPCWISMEERMACGIGACLACVCQIQRCRMHIPMYITSRVCKDGPVFLSTGGGAVMNSKK